MEKFPALKRLPRLTLLWLYVSCAMFVVCVVYTLYFDHEDAAVTTTLLSGALSEDHREPALPPLNPPPKLSPNASHLLRHADTRYVVNAKKDNVPHQTSSTTTTQADTCHTRAPKLILLWTSFFGYWGYMPQESFGRCRQCGNCVVTSDRGRLSESDAVVFHARDVDISDLPTLRPANQRWVFYCLESPPYSDFNGMRYMESMFNWTMTYRVDSDIVAPYGSVTKIHPPRQLDLQALEWSFTNKTKSVVWMCSHCPTHGGRDAYIRELRKHIQLDIYGSCGTSVCARGQTDKCFQEFATHYKFFLAFENTICKDYVTEKYFRTLAYDIVPVVFGGADYAKFAAPGSYVDALSFKSPKHLAFFLAGVAKDFKMYSSYFRWRRDYAVATENSKECELCSKLHRTDLEHSSYVDLRKWWVSDSKCETWKSSRKTPMRRSSGR